MRVRGLPGRSTPGPELHPRNRGARSLAGPTLLDEPGVGPICAGKLIVFNPARFTSEAAFARANGTAPQPASSGKTVRYRPSPSLGPVWKFVYLA